MKSKMATTKMPASCLPSRFPTKCGSAPPLALCFAGALSAMEPPTRSDGSRRRCGYLARGLEDLLLLGVSLVARAGLQVLPHRILGNELQAGVGLRGHHQATGDLVDEELQHRVEALQLGLLVYGEVDNPSFQELERLRQEVVPAAFDPLVVQAVLLHNLGDALSAARIHGEHALDVLVALVVRVNPVQRVVDRRSGLDLAHLDVRPRLLDALLGAVYSRLDVELARRSYKERHGPLAYEVNDSLAHLHAGE